MSPSQDPVPAVTEAAATGEVAAIYADIRDVLRVDVVNLVWRHLATIEGALPWAWGALRPLYADGSVAREAAALRAALALPPLPAIAGEVFAGLGLRAEDMAGIRAVLAAYDHTNPMAAVALTALRARLEGQAPGPIVAPGPVARVEPPRIGLPRLPALAEMAPDTAALVTALNAFGTRRPGAVLASMYRHLAHWPPYLSLAWLLLAPLDADGRLAGAVRQARDAVAARADGLLARLAGTAPPEGAARIGAAIEPFAGDVIVKMLVICASLRRATG